MNRQLLICSFAVLVLSALVSCDRRAESGSQRHGLDTVTHSHLLRAAYIDYPPSMIIDPNSKAKSGIMSEVAAEATKALGVDLAYVEETSFASMVDTLNSGRADVVISGIWPSSARALKADFSRVVYYSPVYAYVRVADSRFDSNLAALNKLDNVRIATIDGELSSIIANSDYPKTKAVSLPQQSDVSQLLLEIISGKADITFVEPAIADAFLAKNPMSIKRVSNTPPIRVFPNTFLFRKGDTELRDALNIALVELTNSGRIAAIVKRYDPSGDHFVLPSTPVGP